MKRLIKNIKYSGLLILMLCATVQLLAQGIQVDTDLNNDVCQLGNSSNSIVTISVSKEALTGDNIPLNINLPGTFSSDCKISVTITTLDNSIQFVNSKEIAFQNTGQYTYKTQNELYGDTARNFNVFYRFKPYITCDGSSGTFQVHVEVDCNGNIQSCDLQVKVTARAGNYWEVSKKFLYGNLTCGSSVWEVKLSNNSPNGTLNGIYLGTYSISGVITDAVTATNSGTPYVISGDVKNINNIISHYKYYVKVRNCAPEGALITNKAQYDLILGDHCDSMKGTVSDTFSTVSPNASLSFTKYYSGQNMTPNCEGKYYIRIYNNGNIPWENMEVTDVIPPEIQVISSPGVHVPSGWTWVNFGSTYTFESENKVLQPGESVYISIPFKINNTAQPGDSICNTASIAYQAVGSSNIGSSTGGNGSTVSPCPGISCPEIDTAIQNTSYSTCFAVDTARAIPRIHKCILDPPTSSLYSVGDIIHFRVNIGNSGAGDMTNILKDALGSPQNLQIIPSSIQYDYYSDVSTSKIYSCTDISTPSTTSTFVSANTSDLQNPVFNISNMPGVCKLNRMNMLSITFDAKILPQTHGSKKNTAVLETTGSGKRTSTAKYSVDAVGRLSIFKKADKELVETGQSFNYILTITNSGSVNLDTISITDFLPECVQLADNVKVKDASGSPVNFSTSGNINVNFNPSASLAPGLTDTVLIQVKKVSGSNCCNVNAKASASMTTTGARLHAVSNGTESLPAACVRSTSCCDIPDFEAHLEREGDKFYLKINGGNIPLQEVDVTMMDFDIDYNYPDCKPDSMDMVGELSSSTGNLGGLILNTAQNPSGTISWGLGSPSQINNNTVELEVTHPNVVDIPCCKVNFSFCLLIRAKDANCNVCEKKICYTPSTSSCDLEGLKISDPKDVYCSGDQIHITWSGNTPSGNIDVYLVGASPNFQTYTVASGISSNSHSFTFNLPNNIPCGKKQLYHILIKDSKGNCHAKSFNFIVDCCKVRCDCGKWESHSVGISWRSVINHNHIPLPKRPMLSNNKSLEKTEPQSTYSLPKLSRFPQIGRTSVDCEGVIKLRRGWDYTLQAPDFLCNPKSCTAKYIWIIRKDGNPPIQKTGQNINYTFTPGVYKISIIPECGGKRCRPCNFTVYVGDRKTGPMILERDNLNKEFIPKNEKSKGDE